MEEQILNKIVDSHIHLDKYLDDEIKKITMDAEMLISVSMNLHSCKRNLEITKEYSTVYSAFGFHPEQLIPSEVELSKLFSWLTENHEHAIAIGEVGLPFYLREQGKLKQSYDQYIELLEGFIQFAKQYNKPIALHAVYDDAHIVCDLLEKHTMDKAHFHWYKGDKQTIERLISNRYFISITPEVLYKEKIRKIVREYPLDLMMVETDGPWPFEGPFVGKKTRPRMIHRTIADISKIKGLPLEFVYQQIYLNTNNFYVVK